MRGRMMIAASVVWLAWWGYPLSDARAMEAQAQAEAEFSDEVEDVIVVRGRRGRGMAAFEAGDYVTAEVEFDKNARCAQRKERNRLAALDQIQANQTTQSLGGGAAQGVQGNPTGPGTAAAPPPPPASPSFVPPAGMRAEGTRGPLDCGDRAFQLYMRGLSQIQLGKVDEAEDSFRRAGDLDRDNYDAQYRLGLIAVLRGDEDAARWRLGAVERILKRCRRRCDEREEIVARRDHLASALRGEAIRD